MVNTKYLPGLQWTDLFRTIRSDIITKCRCYKNKFFSCWTNHEGILLQNI